MSRFSTEPLNNFACSRRELPGKLFAIAGALLLPERRPEVLASPTEVQPKFNIGDLVASDWNPDEEDDDAPESATDFGQVLGMRWLPEAESGLDPKTWVYYVWWTHSTIGGTCFPCYDGESTRECDLRLVSRS
jgi:hypothetical protein